MELIDIAGRLDDAVRHARATPQLERPLTVDEAYQIQAASMARRYARGERRVGVKMGFTSRAKMAQMGIDDLIWGRLTDAMIAEDGGEVRFDAYVHPRIEPEIAFLLNKPLPAQSAPWAVLSAIEGVAPALEIIDSRYRNFKFSLTDVIADNSSSAGFVVGPWRRPGIDLANLGMVMEINGEARQIGSSAAILGNPLRSLIAAARLAAAAGEPLEAGDIVMAGGATAAEQLSPGDHVRLTAHQLGSVEIRIGRQPVTAR